MKKATSKTVVKAAPKKSPVKAAEKAKPAPKKVASDPKKTRAGAPAKKAKSTQKKKLTRIVAHLNAGWGNMLYIRGEGAGLSWEQGVPMLCENDAEWHWVAETAAEPISFKFLVNDEKWALGENITINAGDIHISEPIF